jgi:hypothetical protein
MNPFRKQSDGELVDALRRTERYRRPAGLALIVLGLALLGFHLWGEVWMKDKALELAATVADIQRLVPSAKPDQSAPIAYAAGFRSGLLLSQGVLWGSLFLALGIRLRFGGRKDRMLIHHFDLVTNGQVGPKG